MAVGSKRTSERCERMSERSGGRERSEQSGASERVSGASERANGRASGPVLTSRFLVDPDHSGMATGANKRLAIKYHPLPPPRGFCMLSGGGAYVAGSKLQR